MAFNEQRARAFAEYTLTALLKEAKGTVLTAGRADLAKVLDVQKLWDSHIELVQTVAAKYDVGTANLGNIIAFFELNDVKKKAIDVNDAKAVTDRFEHVFGSQAADEIWENSTYRTVQR